MKALSDLKLDVYVAYITETMPEKTTNGNYNNEDNAGLPYIWLIWLSVRGMTDSLSYAILYDYFTEGIKLFWNL